VFDGRRVELQFAVRDTGIGVPPEKQRFILSLPSGRRFIDRKYGGTGLGLAIVKRLLDLVADRIGGE